MRPLLLLLLLALPACITVNRDLQTYVDAFADEAQARGVEVSRSVAIEFVTVLHAEYGPYDEAAAVCTPRGIQVSEKFWDDPFWDEASRRAVVFHELGHCLLGLGHEDRGHRSEAISLMDPVAIGGPWYSAHEAQLLDRLFSQAPPSTTVEVQAVGIEP